MFLFVFFQAWHKPDDISSTTPITAEKNSTVETSNVNPNSNSDSNANTDKSSSIHITSELDSEAAPNTGKEINVPTTEPETMSSTTSSVTLNGDGSSLSPAEIADLELKSDMETLLEVLHEVYINMIALVGSYQENNEELRNTEYSSEGK